MDVAKNAFKLIQLMYYYEIRLFNKYVQLFPIDLINKLLTLPTILIKTRPYFSVYS